MSPSENWQSCGIKFQTRRLAMIALRPSTARAKLPCRK